MYKKTLKSSNKNVISESGNVTKLAFNDNGSVAQESKSNAERIDNLKLAIDKGDYAINPLRVAEKFIEFENQLIT